ncbi:HAMP domain-containing sensor histidine kinase [Clostridium sediminicola]|uniref:sensor histidine kinase n=1 Tax=Clostridium sediminicola TaxID=3114879 RepID=UPI0031F27C77
MRFRWKISLLCIGIYITTLFITGITITENSYNNLLNREVNRSILEAQNIKDNIGLYLNVLDKQNATTLSTREYSQRIIEVFYNDKSYFQIFGDELQILASNTKELILFNRIDIKRALGTKKDNYILKTIEDKHYLFINSYIEINNNRVVVSYIKDINYVDLEKDKQYSFFILVGLIGFVIIAMVTGVLTNYVIKPITNLSQTVRQISAGNYEKRVEITSSDEICELAIEFNKMADKIQSQIKELELESENKQIFIDDLTHEIRTPLTSIIGYADILRDMNYDKGKFDKGLGYIYSEGNRMLKLSKTLMNLILVREEDVVFEEIDSSDLLKDVKSVLDIKAKNKGINVFIEDKEVFINGDRALLKQLFINILENAIKASNLDGKIIIGNEDINGDKIIYIKDFGVGMDKEELEKITEPFYRVNKSRSRKEGGVGLGLTICKEIVMRHSAEMKIESESNKGTEIRVYFNNNKKTQK